jgi:hypothetical protein
MKNNDIKIYERICERQWVYLCTYACTVMYINMYLYIQYPLVIIQIHMFVKFKSICGTFLSAVYVLGGSNPHLTPCICLYMYVYTYLSMLLHTYIFILIPTYILIYMCKYVPNSSAVYVPGGSKTSAPSSSNTYKDLHEDLCIYRYIYIDLYMNIYVCR